MKPESLPLDGIRVWQRLRSLVPEKVEAMVASLREVGLQSPIHVRIIDRLEEEDRTTEGVAVLVAGLHRLEAARRLGWEEIEAYVIEGGEREARLWEIAENLHRAELTVQERADHIAEWVRLMEDGQKAAGATCAGSLSDGRKRGPQHQPSGINAAVRELGVDRTEAQRAVKIAGITPEAREAADAAGLNTQKARLQIASVPVEQQLSEARRIATERGIAHIERERLQERSKPVPLPKNELETEDDWRNAMMRLWNRAPDEWRERFIDYVQSPVFDNTRAGAG